MLALKAAVCPSAPYVDTSLFPHRHNNQMAKSQQRDANGDTDHDDDLVSHAV